MDLAKHWRQRAARYRLEGQRNTSTGEIRFPPEPLLDTERATWTSHTLGGRGTVYSFSVVRQEADGYDDQPYRIVAMIRLDEGMLITAQMTDCAADQVAIDMPVEMVTRRLRDLGPDGLILYGYSFRPRLEA